MSKANCASCGCMQDARELQTCRNCGRYMCRTCSNDGEGICGDCHDDEYEF